MKIPHLFFCALLIVTAARAEDHYTDVIDPAVHYQTIEYFAASDAWSIPMIASWSLENRQKVADLLFSDSKGIGLSGWRFNLGGGIERTQIHNPWRSCDTFETAEGKYDWTRCPDQRWFLAAAKERGVKHFIAFCNSPPRRLTVNGLTSLDPRADNLTNNLKPGMERQYGVYLADILAHFRDNPQVTERINFDWVSPINEPQWEWTGGQEGSRASDADIIRQYKAIGVELASHKLGTHILGPESGNIPDLYQRDGGASGKHKSEFGDYVNALCNAPGMESILDHEIGYHSYWSDDPNQLIDNRKRLRASLDKHPNWRAAETEYCVMEPGRDLTMNTAIRAIRIVHADLTIVNSVAWSWWLAVSNGNYKDGLIFTNWRHPGDAETILPSKLFWSLGNYARFIRPGMVRLNLKSNGEKHDINGLMASAYRDPVTGRIVAVYVNAMDHPATVELRIDPSKGVTWTPYVTSDKDGDDLRAYPPVGAGQSIKIPAMAVVTVVNYR